MNLIDLPDLMHERSEFGAVPLPHEIRIDSIERRIVAGRRRHRVGVLAGIVALAVLGLAVLVVALPGSTRHPIAPATKQTVKGFPEYGAGSKLVVVKSGSLAATLSITITPTRLPISYLVKCPHAHPDTAVYLDMAVNGYPEGVTSCAATSAIFGDFDGSTRDGLRLGQPATFTFTPMLTTREHRTTGADPGMPSGTVTAALYQSVPPDQYPLPKRPPKLQKLDIAGRHGLKRFELPRNAVISVVKSDSTNWLAPRAYTFTYPHCGIRSQSCVVMGLESQTPGSFTFSIDGAAVSDISVYSYVGDVHPLQLTTAITSLGLHAGETVTLTITPQFVTGGWQFGSAQTPAH
ncbi:MAG TPA: hypothetical protein VGF84_14995 [Micromonosporaceae bacterium]|jgi:hypothetical protein